MGFSAEDEALKFSKKYNEALTSVRDKVKTGEIQMLATHTLPTTTGSATPTLSACSLGPHFPEGMPRRISKVLCQEELDDSCHFTEHGWSSWSCSRPDGWPTLTDEWQAWVPRMEHFYADHWKRIGIYDTIKLTEQDIVVEKPLLAAALCFWSSATNTMNLLLGPMSPTVMDMCILIGLQPTGAEIGPSHKFPTTFRDSLLPPKRAKDHDKEAKTEAIKASKRSRNYGSLYKKYAVVDSELANRRPVGKDEHTAFLYYWLCKYVFCSRARQCPPDYAILADALASGTRLALSPFVLANLYRNLHNIVTNDMDLNVGGPLWVFQLWLRAYFPHTSASALETGHGMFYGRQLMAASSSFMPLEKCFAMFYTSRNFKDLRPCYTQWRLAFLASNKESEKNLSDEEWRKSWGSFVISRDLHHGLTLNAHSKPGVEVYLPNYFARQFGCIQSCPVLYNNSLNLLTSWRRKVHTKDMCDSVSRRYHDRLNRFKLEGFQSNSAATPTFVSWWVDFSTKFVDPEYKDMFTERIVRGVGDILLNQTSHKRKRASVSHCNELSTPRQRSSVRIEEIFDENSPMSSNNGSDHFIGSAAHDDYADGYDENLNSESANEDDVDITSSHSLPCSSQNRNHQVTILSKTRICLLTAALLSRNTYLDSLT